MAHIQLQRNSWRRLGGDFVEALADAVPEGRHGSLGGLSQVQLELSEGHLDRIQVGRIGRQQAQPWNYRGRVVVTKSLSRTPFVREFVTPFLLC